MSYLRLLGVLAFLVLSAGPAVANVLNKADWLTFIKFVEKTSLTKDDLLDLMKKTPSLNSTSDVSRLRNCLAQLTVNLDLFREEFLQISNLVGLATKMSNEVDELWVLEILRIKARGFLTITKQARPGILRASLASYCSEEGATVAKTQEILRTFEEAVPIVESIARKIDSSTTTK